MEKGCSPVAPAVAVPCHCGGTGIWQGGLVFEALQVVHYK